MRQPLTLKGLGTMYHYTPGHRDHFTDNATEKTVLPNHMFKIPNNVFFLSTVCFIAADKV
jgi:hypothetical protein